MWHCDRDTGRVSRCLIPYKVYIPKVCIPWLRITRGKQGIKYNLLLFRSRYRSSSSSIGSSCPGSLSSNESSDTQIGVEEASDDANTESDSDAPYPSDVFYGRYATHLNDTELFSGQ